MRIESFSKMWSNPDRPVFPLRGEPLPYMQQLCNALQVGLTLIAARPLMGASTLAVSLAMILAKKGRKVLYCAHQQQHIPNIVERYRVEEKKGSEELKDLPFSYSNMVYPRTYEDFESTMWNTFLGRKDVHYIFVDCLQDFEVDERFCEKQSAEEYLCKKLRALSYNLDVPIIALTHLNRQPEYRSGIESKIPQLGDFRGGDLATYANQIYFPYRPAYYHIYYDAKTGEDIRNQMFVYAIGRVNGLNAEMRLTFDPTGARVFDSSNIVNTPQGSAKGEEIQQDLAF